MTRPPVQFAFPLRILHWLMVALLVAMLFIGVGMVSSVGDYHSLLAIHRPMGILILCLAAIRLVTRLSTRSPEFPPAMPHSEQIVAKLSERLLYSLFIALPLVGWAMLSAGDFPIVMFGSVHLPPLLPAKPMLYATLRKTHTILAYLLFLTFLAHMGAVLFHTLVLRDGLLKRMALWSSGRAKIELTRQFSDAEKRSIEEAGTGTL
jgi:cytochrome b561